MTIVPEFPPSDVAEAGLSTLARGVIGSEILKIAAEIRALSAKGASICNLTVGDFDSVQFPVPAELLEGTRAALAAGHTNYPPSDGVLMLREVLVRLYERELGLKYPLESVLVTGGARPLLYGSYRTLIDPGDIALYSVPSWNNGHYAYLSGARALEIPVTASSNFFPTADHIRPHISVARIVCINSPLNPTGTVIDKDELRRIAILIVEENARRSRAGARPVYLIFDQVYWKLTFGDAVPVTPIALVPEIAPYTILIDAISKSFCATGLRVGWGFMPPAVRKRMGDILGHVGAWAPKAEQVATASLIDASDAAHAFQSTMKAKIKERLDALYAGFMAMKNDGFPVDAIVPQGAIYLSARFNLVGKTVQGRALTSNEEIRRLLLEAAGLAIVPFQAFGLKEDSGWFRLSVGAVSTADITAAFPRLRALMEGSSHPSAMVQALAESPS
jgi:aspartate aminotransferase